MAKQLPSSVKNALSRMPGEQQAVFEEGRSCRTQRHGFTSDDVFDGTRYDTRTWQRLMVEEQKSLTLRSSGCRNAGHRPFDKYNHCIQCNPAAVAHVKRYSTAAYIYIAGSLVMKTLKIGISTDLEQRSYKLNFDGYGGAADWKLLFHMKVAQAARLEHVAIASLSRYAVRADYLKDGMIVQEARELVECSYPQALKAILDANPVKLGEPWQSSTAKDFSF